MTDDMTDDDMDVRLRNAGAAWRTATDDPHALVADLSPEEELRLGRPVRRNRHRTAWLATAAAVAAVLIAGGGFLLGRLGDDHGHRTSGAESDALENTTWQLLGYDGDHPRQSSFATLSLHDGLFVADDTCNLYNGSVKVEGDHLRLADVEDRFYNCTDAVGEVTFDRGLKTLKGDPTWSIDGDRLTISGDGPTLHLAAAPNLPAPTPDRPTLTGATWRLTKVADANGTEQPVRGNADFRIDGDHLHASDTCNTLDGTLQLDYPILKLDGLATTEIGCPQDSAAPTVDRVLTGEVRVDFRDTTLTLTKAGAGTLTYQWHPDDEPATDPKRLTVTDWQLRSIAGAPASGMTLSVRGGRLELSAGCASSSVPVELGPGTIAAPGLGKEPKNECPRERMDVKDMLAGAPALWRIAGHQLVINHAGSQGFSLVFDAEKDVSVAAAELVGVVWRLSSVEQSSNATASGHSVLNGPSLRFDGEDAFTVNARCSELFGKADLGAREIVFTDLRPAPHSCPPLPANAYNDAEDMVAVEHTLAGSVSWSIENGQLRLTNGKITLTFER